ncbi:putative protein arginine N-methyltransferase [Monocercomonoides exilis]|uniref:putative protein arginine N-methyltransferase n=1 Tax=Monocercomonoides exilis TaxID=2049356 RepID=UPI003559905E|nr:putative protein arginine N-methyltransferase [Monocercomonoides exilis]|eukprot:MONOS_11719.1-p1 / transcript=MONOS_11719.1 / gene=MONOS_11719 / organism=Monocercomonoides_exilis_PA203 / gene_product=Os10g0489100 / transcript_product=Os10g0489100 / location=Mono_scaffold00604:23613-25316(-) / protein_length=510 / sequence_SO=supercontig / SO=protein_coding / is_pseudo=false
MLDNTQLNSQRNEVDRPYFDSYSHLSIHHTMLRDQIRTLTYRNAILQATEDFKDKVVLDVGCGTGILSHFCLKSGAKKVYAVDASDIADQAKRIAEDNGVADKIIIIKGKIEEIEIPEEVDIIVSEWMGYGLLYESMFDSVIVARDKWLKKDTGFLFPSHARMFMAPFSDERFYKDTISFWKDVNGVNMESLIPFAKKCFYQEAEVVNTPVESVIANEVCLKEFELRKTRPEDLREFSSEFMFKSQQIGEFNGFCVWFDVAFESPSMRKRWLSGEDVCAHMQKTIEEFALNDSTSLSQSGSNTFISSWKSKNSEQVLTLRDPPQPLRKESILEGYTAFVPCAPLLSTSPFSPSTHWSQTILHIPLRLYLLQDDEIKGRIKMHSMDVKVSRKMTFEVEIDIPLIEDCEAPSSSSEDESDIAGGEESTFALAYLHRAFKWMDEAKQTSGINTSASQEQKSDKKELDDRFHYIPGITKSTKEIKDLENKVEKIPQPPPLIGKIETHKYSFALV